jgi:hypothetical protein
VAKYDFESCPPWFAFQSKSVEELVADSRDEAFELNARHSDLEERAMEWKWVAIRIETRRN